MLAWASGTPSLAIAIAAVIFLNAGFSFAQELQAERAVEALAAFLPERAPVLRDGTRADMEARLLVPGDVLLVEEGERICADARLIIGTVEVDMSTLTGESVPVTRSADAGSQGLRSRARYRWCLAEAGPRVIGCGRGGDFRLCRRPRWHG